MSPDSQMEDDDSNETNRHHPDIEVDVAIVGGGPSGMAVGIDCQRRGLSYVIVEKGTLVDGIRRFPTNMVFFTTPELLEIGGLPLVSHREKPSRFEALKYYRRVAEHFDLKVHSHTRVTRVSKQGNTFHVDSQFERDMGGAAPGQIRASDLVLAVGYYDNPNHLDIPGEELDKVSHYYTEAHAYYGQKVAVIGAGNSAAETALDLYRAGVDVTLIHRRADVSTHIKYWVRPDIKNRIDRKEITAFMEAEVVAIQPLSLTLRDKHGRQLEIENDAVLAMVGYQPDYRFLEAAGVEIDRATGKPNVDEQTYETNVPGLYLAGGVVAGRATNKIFIENGRFHGEKIVRHIAAKRQAESKSSV